MLSPTRALSNSPPLLNELFDFVGIVEVIGAVLCITLIHYTGKRPLTFTSTIGCGICFGLTATYAFLLPNMEDFGVKSIVQAPNITNETFSQALNILSTEGGEVSNEYSWIPLTLLLGSALLSHSGIRLLPWILVGEVFSSKVRATGAGFASGMGYVFGFLANKLFLQMIETLTLPGTFWLYAAVAFVGAGVLFKILPETEGRTLIVSIGFWST